MFVRMQRLWTRLSAWLAGAEEIPLGVEDLILDVWDDVPHVAPPVRPRALPPPIPIEVRKALAPLPPSVLTIALGSTSSAPSGAAAPIESAWDDVIARAKAGIGAAHTPAPSWKAESDEAQWSDRLDRAKARARTSDRRRSPTGDVQVRWTELMAGAQSAQSGKAAPTGRRKRRRSSAISLACAPVAESTEPATPSPVLISGPITTGNG